MAGARTRVTLPGGLWRDGRRLGELDLRPMSGADDAFLADLGDGLTPAERTTALLARCAAEPGGDAIDPAVARSLGVGDREALMLQVRRLTSGDRLDCVLDCPDCGETMEFELEAAELLVDPDGERPARHEATLAAGDGEYRVAFRLPTGDDQEAAAALARRDPDAAVALVLDRCVEEVRDSAGAVIDGDVPEAVGGGLPALMEDLDPQAAIELTLACPECGAERTTPFDAAAFVFAEARSRSRRLEREVHALAMAYGWSEADIAQMPAARRERYLDLVWETPLEARR